MTAIGLFGGTFAPIHNGHLRLAIELRELLGLDCVHVVPSARPPHRAAPGVSAERRLEWARLAIADEPGLLVDDCEVRRAREQQRASYTIDTLAAMKAAVPDARLHLLLGDDAANRLHTWHRWRDLFSLAHLVVVQRPQPADVMAPEVAEFLHDRIVASADALRGQSAGLWLPVRLPPLAISATRIRALLKAGRSVRGLLPEAVIRSLTPEDVRALTIDEDQDPAHD